LNVDEGNRISSTGVVALVKGLAENKALLQLNLLSQSKGAFGDACLTDVINMFEKNVTIRKITWRLDSRKSFAINKLIVRNNDIHRRVSSGRDVSELLPGSVNSVPPGARVELEVVKPTIAQGKLQMVVTGKFGQEINS